MLLNLSNHPYSLWSEKQKETAHTLYGDVIDMPFPFVGPELSTGEVKNLVSDYYGQVLSFMEEHKGGEKLNAVHIQGEFIFVFHMVTLLKKEGITCVASTSKRDVKQEGGKKIINFNFIQFREY